MSASVAIRRLAHAAGLPLPAYESAGAAAMDLRAAVEAAAPLVIEPGRWAPAPTGFCIALPEGYEAQVRPRSGLALNFGITCLNSPGTIDADYRGEIRVILINHGREPFTVRRGDRIAQLVIAPVSRALLTEAETLDATARGEGGFGSTGRA